MMRSLYSAVSGLRNHQTRMDVIGNNIANVNTAGFKASRTIFQDVYSQTSRTASAGTANGEGPGGVNPIQIGLGVKLATIDTMHNSAALARTDNPLDVAIEGDGFFTVWRGNDPLGPQDETWGNQEFYTRAGNFYIDDKGYLVTANGDNVIGVMADPTMYNADGTVTWPDAETDWPTDNGSDIVVGGAGDTEPNPGNPERPPAGDEGEPVAVARADLMKIGNLQHWKNIAIDSRGFLTGIPVNGDGNVHVIAQLAITTFINPMGLEKTGSSLYRETKNSGNAEYGAAGNMLTGAGMLNPGGLEMSNVDLADQFTDMIVTQRGFQANSRIITVSDSLLEELVNLKR